MYVVSKIKIMKIVITIISLFFYLMLSSQTPDSLKTKKHSVGVSFSPDYCFRKLTSNPSSEWIKDGLDTLEVGKIGYTTGLNYTFRLSKRIGISTGVLLSNKGEKTKKTFSSQPSIFNYNNQYYYLDIPLTVKYNIINKTLKLFVSAGISSNIFLVKKTTQITGYTNDDVKINYYDKDGLSKVNLAILAGFGIEYPITKKWDLKIEPIFRRSITPIANTPVKKYLYSIGINIGLSTSF